MNSYQDSIGYRAGRYVMQLLRERLPKGNLFHNMHHTLNVVQATVKIGRAEALSESELEIVILAAWFHDAGHITCYEGHEEISITLAEDWLKKQGYPAERIAAVGRCIQATTMPQQPADRLECVICDADLSHLAFPLYDHYQDLLREEWKLRLGIEMTDAEWREHNANFLREHHYWTAYGRRHLAAKKKG